MINGWPLLGIKDYEKASMHCHLVLVQGLGCLNDSKSYVVKGRLPLVGSPCSGGYGNPALEPGLGKGSIGTYLVARLGSNGKYGFIFQWAHSRSHRGLWC